MLVRMWDGRSTASLEDSLAASYKIPTNVTPAKAVNMV